MLRADALATVHLFHPFIRRMGSRPNRVPILMYHSVTASRDEQRHPYYGTITTPQVFAQHMRYLHENKYVPVTLREAVHYIEGGGDPTARPIAITFDDGFRDFYTDAFPILDQFGFRATMFLPTASISDRSRKFKGVECLTWGQIRELMRCGVEFGSHTVSHPQLTSLGPVQLEFEVRESKAVIEQELGCSVRSFAYPYAFPETDRAFVDMLRGMLRGAGYEHGVSTVIGTADRACDRFFMHRLPINCWDNAALFMAKIEGAYDWLHMVQYAAKVLRYRK